MHNQSAAPDANRTIVRPLPVSFRDVGRLQGAYMRNVYHADGSRLERGIVGQVAAFFFFVSVIAAAYGVVVLLGTAKEILVAVIAAAATLLSAIFGYLFQRTKELELAWLHRKQELEFQQRRVTQENYGRIIQGLASFIRNPKQSADDFATAHLFTWVTGSPEVVLLTLEFIEQPNPSILDRLLLEMRRDLSLETDRNLLELSTAPLFQVPEPPGGFPPQTSAPIPPIDQPLRNRQR